MFPILYILSASAGIRGEQYKGMSSFLIVAEQQDHAERLSNWYLREIELFLETLTCLGIIQRCQHDNAIYKQLSSNDRIGCNFSIQDFPCQCYGLDCNSIHQTEQLCILAMDFTIMTRTNGLANDRAWSTIQVAGSTRQFSFQHVDNVIDIFTNKTWRIKYSYFGFDTPNYLRPFVATQPHSSSGDDQVIYGGGTDTFPTFGTLLKPNGTYVQQILEKTRN